MGLLSRRITRPERSGGRLLRRSNRRHENLVRRIKDGAQLARREIREGRFERSMAVLAAFSAIVSGFEAFVQHSRGAFSNRLMWTPVALTPPMVLAAAVALVNPRGAKRILPVASLAALADGLIGFVLHLRGIVRMPGGLGVGQYNVVMGPPIFAPLLMTIVGILGMLATALRPEKKRDWRVEIGDSFWPVHDSQSPFSRSGAETPRFSLAPPARAWSQTPRHRRGVRGNLQSRISQGRFQRIMALISGFLAILAGGEAYFEHLRGSYNQRVMWTPVWVTPPMVASAIGAMWSEQIAERVLPLTSAVTFLDGMLGFLLHLRGIKRMPGGFENLEFNVTMGPPLFAPLLFSAVGLLGLMAVLLRRKR